MSSTLLPQPGEVVAEKYRIEEPLGEGGMAVVFAAHHLLLDKPVALKILSPELPRLPQLRGRFLIEARAAARVDSPHVARVMDVGTMPNGLPYMVLERLKGCDLDELLRVEGHLAIGDAVDYVLQALQGLAHAHTLGVVHRDLKPANLFLSHQSDGSAIIKILDFGIAKLSTSGSDEEPVSRTTQQGQAVGTPMYMSPEHVRNEKLVDHRTDIWAIGVVLYELITGQTPFEADGIGETFGAVLNRIPTSSRILRPEVPTALDNAILKCMELNPDDRWPDVAQFARAIGPYGTGACTFLVESIEQTLRQQLRRYSGKAIMVRPATASAMSVTVEAPTPKAKSEPKSASAIADRPKMSLADISPPGPMMTPIPFPGLRPRYWRWGLVLSVAAIVTAAYFTPFGRGLRTTLMTSAASSADPAATALVVPASSTSAASSAAISAAASASPSVKSKITSAPHRPTRIPARVHP